jgi:hypothetical protein
MSTGCPTELLHDARWHWRFAESRRDGGFGQIRLIAFMSGYRNAAATDDWWRTNLDLARYYGFHAIVEHPRLRHR